jgi:ABC-type phosphate/phosphonate transport system permease subunit
MCPHQNGPSARLQIGGTVFREQTINFLEAVVVLLTLTNAASAVAAAYALSIAHGLTRPHAKSQETSSSLRLLLRVLRVAQ